MKQILISCIIGLFFVGTSYSQPVIQKTVAHDLPLSELAANARKLENMTEELATIGNKLETKSSENLIHSLMLLWESQCISEIALLLFYEHEGMEVTYFMDKRNLPFVYKFRVERLKVSIRKVKANLKGLRSFYSLKRPKQELELIDNATQVTNSSLRLLDIFKKTLGKATD